MVKSPPSGLNLVYGVYGDRTTILVQLLIQFKTPLSIV